MVLERSTLLYFSGTGNSLQVAKDICDNAGGLDRMNLAVLRNEDTIQVKSEILGIVFPVYYARLPLVVESVVNKLVISKNTYVFAVATYGGAPATVLRKLENMLRKNGKILNAGFLVHMPKNHVLEYSTKPVKIGDRIFVKERERVVRICELIRRKQNYKCEVSRLIFDTIIDNIFISMTDKIMANLNTTDSGYWVNENCNNCKLCEKVCPVNNIEFSTKPEWKHNCERCMACIQLCPKEAIQWGTKTVNRKRYKNPNVDIIARQ